MNALRLNIINLHAPYRVWQKSGKPDHYYFVSDISHLTCPYLSQAIEEFSETISLLFDVEQPKNNPQKKRIIAKWK